MTYEDIKRNLNALLEKGLYGPKDAVKIYSSDLACDCNKKYGPPPKDWSTDELKNAPTAPEALKIVDTEFSPKSVEDFLKMIEEDSDFWKTTKQEPAKQEFFKDATKFERIGTEIGKLVAEKNKAYGNSFAKSHVFLEILYPNGIKPNDYNDMLCILRIFDKLKRISTSRYAFDENPYEDLVGIAIRMMAAEKERVNTND